MYEPYLKKLALEPNAVAQETGLSAIIEYVTNAPNAARYIFHTVINLFFFFSNPFFYLVLVRQSLQLLLRNVSVQQKQVPNKRQQISFYFMQKSIHQTQSL